MILRDDHTFPYFALTPSSSKMLPLVWVRLLALLLGGGEL